jgi:plastocyanin
MRRVARMTIAVTTIAVGVIVLMASAGPALVAAVGLAPMATPARPKPTRHLITIEAVRFQPQSITVKAGDVVVWTNKDPFPHTATSKAASFDSHPIAPDASWTYTATKRGEFSYVCTLHPTMTATLNVE